MKAFKNKNRALRRLSVTLLTIALLPALTHCNIKQSIFGEGSASRGSLPKVLRVHDQKVATHLIRITLPAGYVLQKHNSALTVTGQSLTGELFEGARLFVTATSANRPSLTYSQVVYTDIELGGEEETLLSAADIR